jgi:hypothetical protein
MKPTSRVAVVLLWSDPCVVNGLLADLFENPQLTASRRLPQNWQSTLSSGTARLNEEIPGPCRLRP